MAQDITSQFAIINCKVPLADCWNASPATDIISMAQADHIAFYVYTGANATGDTVLTVESCDDVSATNSNAIAFRITKYETGGSPPTNVPSTASAAVASTGFTTSSTVANASYILEVNAADLFDSAQSSGEIIRDKYVRVASAEDNSGAVAGGIMAILTKTRYKEATMDSVIV